jgi:hypothetical protein
VQALLFDFIIHIYTPDKAMDVPWTFFCHDKAPMTDRGLHAASPSANDLGY